MILFFILSIEFNILHQWLIEEWYKIILSSKLTCGFQVSNLADVLPEIGDVKIKEQLKSCMEDWKGSK